MGPAVVILVWIFVLLLFVAIDVYRSMAIRELRRRMGLIDARMTGFLAWQERVEARFAFQEGMIRELQLQAGLRPVDPYPSSKADDAIWSAADEPAADPDQ